MATAQAGIFDERSLHHRHLELRCNGVIEALVRRLADVEALRDEAVSVVVGLGSEHAASFGLELPGAMEHAGVPHTPADAWIWLHGVEADRVYDRELDVLALLDGVGLVERERVCFRRREDRDLSGFMDGTENPSPTEAPAVALFGDGLLEGSSVVLVQRWVHDLAALRALSEPEQEALFGRTKARERRAGRAACDEPRLAGRDRARRRRAADLSAIGSLRRPRRVRALLRSVLQSARALRRDAPPDAGR